MAKAVAAAKIENALRDALTRNGTYGDYYDDLVCDYMHMLSMERKLQADIRKRGVKVTKRDSKGQEQCVNNESIDQLLKVSTQKLRILTDLGIKAVEAESVQRDKDDLLDD